MREYRGLRLFVDARGLPRIALERVTRYRPVKLVEFERTLDPTLSYEWHEWSRYESAMLYLRRLDARGRSRQEWRLPLRKHLDEEHGLLRYDLGSEQPEAARTFLAELARARPGQQVGCELEWREQMVLNAADRDLVVSYSPIARLRLSVDASARSQFLVSVGDSPGLVRREGVWQLERALLPREVLAVRMRWAGLTAQDALGASPSGEMPGWQRGTRHRA